MKSNNIIHTPWLGCLESLSQFTFKPADPGEPVLRHDGRRAKDGEDEGDAAPDGLLAVEHGPLGHEQLQG